MVLGIQTFQSPCPQQFRAWKKRTHHYFGSDKLINQNLMFKSSTEKIPFSKPSRRRCVEAAWCRCVRTAFGDDVLKTTIEEGNMCARAAKQRHRPAEPTQFRRKVAETADLAETAALLKNIHFLQLAYRKHQIDDRSRLRICRGQTHFPDW